MSAPVTERPAVPAPQAAGERRVRSPRRFARAPMVAVGGWTIGYLAVAVSGFSFSTDYLTYGWQLVPWNILSHHPLSSVWYLHIQPPLWNLILGGAARLSPFSDARTLQAVQFAFGAALVWLLADTLRRLHFSASVVVGLALLATLNPEVLSNAFQPTYELPVAAGLAACVWALVLLAERPTARRVVLVAALATAVSMTRTLYHPVWALVMIAIAGAVVFGKLPLRVVVAASAIPILVIGAWMTKNEVLFHEFTLSTWTGMNLQRSTMPIVPAADVDRLIAEGKISAVAKISPFDSYDQYKPVVPPCTPRHTNPAVTTIDRVDSTGALVPNFNYECFIPVYRQAGADTREVIRSEPRAWVKGRLWSARTTFAMSTAAASSHSSVFKALDLGYRVASVEIVSVISTKGWTLEPVRAASAAGGNGGLSLYGTFTVPARFSLTTLALSLTLLFGGALAALRVLRRRSADRPFDVAVAVSGFLVVFTFVVGAVGELGEQARFRTMTDPLLYAIGGALVLRALGRHFDLPWASATGGRSIGTRVDADG